MAGKIQRAKLPRGGHRGRLGVEGKGAHRAKSRVVDRRQSDRDRSQDYKKFQQLKQQIEELEVSEASGWAGSSASEAKAKAKELKLLRGKLSAKERKHGAGR